MNKLISGCTLAIALASVSCQPTKTTSVTLADLNNTSWKLVSLDENANAAFQEGDLFTLNFVAADSSVNGVGACNRYFGKVISNADNAVDIAMGGATMMACPNMDLETTFFKTLEEMTQVKIENGELLMFKADKQVAKFSPFVPVVNDGHNAANSLDYEGTYTGKLPAADAQGMSVTLTLNTDKTFTSTVEQNGTTSEVKGTYVVDQNRLILTSDKDTTYYNIGENRLMMLDKQGNPMEGDLAAQYQLTKEMK